MKSFDITVRQITSVLGAACADELSRRFNRHYDFLTIASWTENVKLGADGLGLSQEEIRACADRALEFFGVDECSLPLHDAQIADWATVISGAIKKKLTRFSFKSAARNDLNAACHHDAAEIYQDGATAANLLHGRRRLLSFVAPHSLLGFELAVLAPNFLKIESIDCRRMSPDELSEFLRYGDVLVATPTLWRYMMREELRSPDNTMAVAFGEPMEPSLSNDMRKSGFGVLRELYGSTESGLIGWRDDPNEPFVLFDHWRRENGDLLRLAPSGELRAKALMDNFEWKSERSFRLLGRHDGAVQVGAVNVFPDQISLTLRAHPKIADCRISFGQRGDGAGHLIANIVLKNNLTPDEDTAREIDQWCRSQLRQQERPRIYNFHKA